MTTIRILVEEDGNDEDESIKVCFGHTEEEAQTMHIMPLLLSTMSCMEHYTKLADKCIHFHYPHLEKLSPQEQDRIISDFHRRATLANLHQPGTYKTLKIIMP